ncbi:MAG: proton-conducting membrane transporter [Myxococcales bacterium]|nr:proton-conducting membrane transporter [Myxococcales bacterium]
MLADLLQHLFVLAPVWPALAALVIATLFTLPGRPAERVVSGIATVGLWLSLASALAGVAYRVSGGSPDVRLGFWYQAVDYEFPLVMLVDGLAVAMSTFIAVMVLTTARFSVTYLHREPGFIRFFLLMLFFAAGMQLMVLAGSVELMFIGWEIVGITSVLLVGFFHERTQPVQAAIRVLVTYRICDIGLLLSGVRLHHWLGTTVWTDVFPAAASHTPSFTATAIALGFAFAAMGKSAQFPLGGWLPRAMEGPTASSAIFYGCLSVHAGVFLLIRAAPLFGHSPLACTALIVIGLATALMASLSSQVSADAKSAVAYATATQVGLMFVECGLGFHDLATVHLITHATLRYYQFLRTPSALHDALARQAMLGRTEQDEAAARWEEVALVRRRWLYRLAHERFAVEAALDRWITRPIMSFSRSLGRLENRFLALHEKTQPPIGPELSRPLPAASPLEERRP